MELHANVLLQTFLVLVTLTCYIASAYIPPRVKLPNILGSERKLLGNVIHKTVVDVYRSILPSNHLRNLVGLNLRLSAARFELIPSASAPSVYASTGDQVKTLNSSNQHKQLSQILTRVRREDIDDDSFELELEASEVDDVETFGGQMVDETSEEDDEKPPKDVDRLNRTQGTMAKAVSETGISSAVATSSTGDAEAIGINGTRAESVALSVHESGEALAISDTYGEKGASSIALTKENGNATGSSISRAAGNSVTIALTMGEGNALSESVARRGGNSTSIAATLNKGDSTSKSIALNGSSTAQAKSKGTGNSRADSVAGSAKGSSTALASSKQGNVVANSRTKGGFSSALGSSMGQGKAMSNAISVNGGTNAKAIAVRGDSVAKAADAVGRYTKSEEALLREANRRGKNLDINK